MKEYAGKVLMLVENFYPADTRVRNEAATLTEEGFKVSVIALRGPSDRAYEVVNGVSVYRIPRVTLFTKLPIAKRSPIGRILHKMQVVLGYLFEYGYFTSACLFMSLYISANEGIDVIHAHNPPDTLFFVGAINKIFGRRFIFDHHDLCPELYLSRYGRNDGAVFRSLLLLEKLALKMADVVIATNE